MNRIVTTRKNSEWVAYERKRFLFIPYWIKIYNHSDIEELRKYIKKYETHRDRKIV